MFANIIKILLIGIIGHFILFHKQTTPKDLTLPLSDTHELTQTNLFHENSTLTESGWSFRQGKQINVKHAPGAILGIKSLNRFRYKKYDYYAILAGSEIIQAYVHDFGFQHSIFLKYYNLKQKDGQVTTANYLTIVGGNQGALSIPDTPVFGTDYKARFDFKGHKFSSKDSESGDRKVTVDTPIGQLILNINTPAKDQDSIIEIIPIQEGNQTWLYTHKYVNLQGSAKIQLKTEGGKTRNIGDKITIIQESGRGMFGYHFDSLSVTGGLRTDDKNFGFSLRSGISASPTKKTQFDYFVNGKEGTQLLPVEFKFDKLNWNNSMRFRTGNETLLKAEGPGTCNIVFAPVGNQFETNDFKIAYFGLGHVYGYFSGWIVDKYGVKHDIEGAIGLFESFYGKA